MVVVMMVMPAVMLAMMMVVTVMLVMRRCCVRAAGAEDRHRHSEGKSQPQGREEGLLHDYVSFFAAAI